MQLQNYLLLDTYGKRKPYWAMIQYENLLSAISRPLLEDFTVKSVLACGPERRW